MRMTTFHSISKREVVPVRFLLWSFLSDCVTKVTLKIMVFSCKCSDVDIYSDTKLSNFECADDTILVFRGRRIIYDLFKTLGMLQMCFAISRSKVLLPGCWVYTKPCHCKVALIEEC